MRIHYLQHVPFEGPGYIAHWARQAGHIIEVTRLFDTGFQLPSPSALDVLVVMGGPMSVNELDAYPWLKQEMDFIGTCISLGKKVLGICLGAQLIAACLGATVGKAQNTEIGWYPVLLCDNELSVPWMDSVFGDGMLVFHWHGECFDLPAESIHLLHSVANPNQAFLYKDHVLGLQFHLEVDLDAVDALVLHCSDDLIASPYVQSAEIILKTAKEAIPELNSRASLFLEAFIGRS